MSFGPAPWQQTNWDWRAAGNFVCGGAGAGLIVFAVLSGTVGTASVALLLGALALVGVGLACVWLEIGRPLRALHVFLNPRTSWMSRESIAATLLFPIGLATAAGASALAWVTAALAFAFIYCQGRMLRGAKGIPAWREPLVTPLIILTGLTEGAGLFHLTSPWHDAGSRSLLLTFGALLIGRAVVWLAYRRRLAGVTALPAAAALDRTGRWLEFAGTLVPLALIAPVAGGLADTMSSWLVAIAGLAALLAGAHLKYTIITAAGFNQGFALAHLPVRGVRVEPMETSEREATWAQRR